MTFDSHIQGIPCQIHVTTNAPPVPSNRNCDPLDDPYDPGCFEFEVLDRKGYPAEWLERKMTDRDRDRIADEAGQERYEAAAIAAEMRADERRENW